MSGRVDDLIGRLEAATGADRELDAAIAQAFGFQGWTEGAMWFAQQIGAGEIVAPAFTASIDAALTLVPANALWSVKALWDQGPDAIDGPKAYRGSVDIYEVRDGLFWKDNHLSLAATPALAIVIAALRAQP